MLVPIVVEQNKPRRAIPTTFIHAFSRTVSSSSGLYRLCVRQLIIASSLFLEAGGRRRDINLYINSQAEA